MMHCNKTIALSLVLAAAMPQLAGAASMRLDSGGWSDGILVSDGTSTTTAVGFEMDFFGAAGDTITVNADGSVALQDGAATTATFFPLFNPGSGSSVQYTISTTLTDGSFDQTGIDAGLRVQWFNDNVYQLSMFELSNGQYALEFNYERVVDGANDTTQTGWDIGGAAFDLLDALGLTFDDVVGFGLDTNGGVDECLTADTLACNNFYADVFGPDNSILPDIADGYFRSLSGTDDTPAQGRYLWISGVAVSEAPVLALFVAGLIALRLTRRRQPA